MKPAFNIVPMAIIFFFTAGLGQELGWAGFLMPRQQAHFSALTSCLIRAIVVGIWHLPLLIYIGFHPYALPDFPYGIWIVQKGFLVTLFAMVFLFILPWSIFTPGYSTIPRVAFFGRQSCMGLRSGWLIG